MKQRMKYQLMTFFAGRNGIDALEVALIGIAALINVANIFVSNAAMSITLSTISLILLCVFYFRMMSRNLAKRSMENAAFVGFWSRRKLNFQQRKTHKFYGCPTCKATLRVPKGKGKITITCNRCGTQFIKKT